MESLFKNADNSKDEENVESVKQKKVFIDTLMKYYENGCKIEYSEVKNQLDSQTERKKSSYLIEYDAGVFALQGSHS